MKIGKLLQRLRGYTLSECGDYITLNSGVSFERFREDLEIIDFGELTGDQLEAIERAVEIGNFVSKQEFVRHVLRMAVKEQELLEAEQKENYKELVYYYIVWNGADGEKSASTDGAIEQITTLVHKSVELQELIDNNSCFKTFKQAKRALITHLKRQDKATQRRLAALEKLQAHEQEQYIDDTLPGREW